MVIFVAPPMHLSITSILFDLYGQITGTWNILFAFGWYKVIHSAQLIKARYSSAYMIYVFIKYEWYRIFLDKKKSCLKMYKMFVCFFNGMSNACSLHMVKIWKPIRKWSLKHGKNVQRVRFIWCDIDFGGKNLQNHAILLWCNFTETQEYQRKSSILICSTIKRTKTCRSLWYLALSICVTFGFCEHRAHS